VNEYCLEETVQESSLIRFSVGFCFSCCLPSFLVVIGFLLLLHSTLWAVVSCSVFFSGIVHWSLDSLLSFTIIGCLFVAVLLLCLLLLLIVAHYSTDYSLSSFPFYTRYTPNTLSDVTGNLSMNVNERPEEFCLYT